MKVVDLVTRNSDQLSLHFYNFSMNLYRFYKFAVFENKKKRKRDLASRPLERFGRLQIGPWQENRGGANMAGRNPAWGLTGGVGEVGEKLHGIERNPWIASVGAGTAGGGGATEQQLRRRGHTTPAVLRRGRSGEDRPERTSGRWRTDSEGSRGWRMAGGGGSTAG